jgi:hypothetical protein
MLLDAFSYWIRGKFLVWETDQPAKPVDGVHLDVRVCCNCRSRATSFFASRDMRWQAR